ncbi:unnamed protein product [Effrenium voratum]|nr:unnamed protein product [Effrenium voratum]
MMYTQGAAPYSAQPMTYSAGPVTYSASPYAPSSAMPFAGAPGSLDHAQGKWFAPGEALPPGFVVTAHPEGHTAPAETHAMSDKARESFVVSSGLPMKTGTASSSKADSGYGWQRVAGYSAETKKSKKKKSSGCC